MNNKALLLLTIGILFVSKITFADEGMWIPLLLEKYNIEEMKSKGFKLTAEDIYSINQASMKDAIVIFGRGCTGELISAQGLIMTNHHCGYGAIQQHSSLENNYLEYGFWAKNKNEELYTPNLTVTFLEEMRDVTKEVLDSVNDNMTEDERAKIIQKQIAEIEYKAVAGKKFLSARIESFFYGNEYYLFINKIYPDVRLVGSPPDAIGRFGGDTDNWMWPRHTGDFSLFRIYADYDNNPAEYSPENIPYQPKKFFKIDLRGVQKDDFTMVLGYPGTTEEYLPSYGVELLQNVRHPHRVDLRQKKIDILRADMEADKAVRIKYASKYAGISNGWKKWQGTIKGLKKSKAVQTKHLQESEFKTWANTKERAETYGKLLPHFQKVYQNIEPYQLTLDYIAEAAFAIELLRVAKKFYQIYDTNITNISPGDKIKVVGEEMKSVIEFSNNFFKNYNAETDKKIMVEMLKAYYKNIDTKFHPKIFETIQKKYKGNFEQYTNYVFENSNFTSTAKLEYLFEKFSFKKIAQDPALILFLNFEELIKSISSQYYVYNNQLDSLNRIYMRALREMHSEKAFYPDANFTMRLAYGKVDDYLPIDGVHYLHYTTLTGIIEKDNPEVYDYNVPEKLKELYKKEDYGIYGVNGVMYTCFTASNHTTGGNSGSPVLNAEGNLIGINFDRNWEGTMSDIMYDPQQCRNITLDIRYALFIIDKFAGAKNIINELKIIRPTTKK